MPRPARPGQVTEKPKNFKSAISRLIKELESQNEELNTQITEFSVKNKDKQKDIDDLNFDITNLKISVSSFDSFII